MIAVAKLKSIEESLDEIENSTKRYNYAGGAEELVSRLSPPLQWWGSRDRFFEEILGELKSASRSALSARIRELQLKASKTEHMLNLIIKDRTIPPEVTDASIRYVVEQEQLISSPLVQEALVFHAAHGRDEGVRRLAWFHVCKHRTQRMRASKGRWWSPRSAQSRRAIRGIEKVGGERVRNLRQELIKGRSTLGPRGTILKSSEVSSGATELIPDLLITLANSTGVERNEIVLTLGEIGGDETAVLLADALRSEMEASSVDEDYQVNLVSALSNVGGPDAVSGLLQTAEQGSERVRQVALSGLEWLATAGAMALTEYPEPATIDNDAMRDAYMKLSQRLRALVSSSATPPYIRHKARELLETIQISLNSAPASV